MDTTLDLLAPNLMSGSVWPHPKDAGAVDPGTGLITILGRLDSQVSVGGLPRTTTGKLVRDRAALRAAVIG